MSKQPAPETAKNLAQIIMDKLGVTADKVVPGATFSGDLGADSLDEVELIMAVEDEFNLEISDEDAAKLKTVQDALDYITAKIA